MKISRTTTLTTFAAAAAGCLLSFGSIAAVVNGDEAQYHDLDEVIAELNAGLETMGVVVDGDRHVENDVTIEEADAHMTYPGWKQKGMDIIGGEVNSQAGKGVSLSDDGTTVAVGSPFQNDVGVYNGRTRVFRWDDAWIQLGSNIDGDSDTDVKSSGEFICLSADGNTIAIDDKNITVYRYEEGKDWKQLGQDIPMNEDNTDEAGPVSLSNDGNTVAYLGKFEDADGIYIIPYARVYHYDNSTWNQLGSQLNGQTGDSSANVLSLSGDGKTLAIGSFQRLHVYYLDVDKWTAKGADIAVEKLTTSISLSDDGNILAASAEERVNTYVFSDGNWTEIPIGITADFGLFGAVALSGDGKTLAIGARHPEEDIDGFKVPGSEHVRVYNYTYNAWEQLGQDIDGVNPEDDFGDGIALSHNGEVVAIGAPEFDEGEGASKYDDQGHVRVYKLCKDEASCKENEKPATPVVTDGENTTLTDDKDKASTDDKDKTSNATATTTSNTTATTTSNTTNTTSNATDSKDDSSAFSGREIGLLTGLVGLIGFYFVN